MLLRVPAEDQDVAQGPTIPVAMRMMVARVFGNDIANLTLEDLCNRSILASNLREVMKINNYVISRLPGVAMDYLSFDEVISTDRNDLENYPPEYLNNLHPSGMPPHRLTLKIGTIVLLMRNIEARLGLCNGTRLIVTEMLPNAIVLEIISVFNRGRVVFLSRMKLETEDKNMPVQIAREQFPLIPAFAMTINKSQGQTIERVGIYLQDSVFAHGQLYVASSRTRLPQNISMYIRDQGARQGRRGQQVFTRNVVYREVFNYLNRPVNRLDPIEALTDSQIMDMVEMAEAEIYSPDIGSNEQGDLPALEDDAFTPLHLQVSGDEEELDDNYDYRRVYSQRQDRFLNDGDTDDDDEDRDNDEALSNQLSQLSLSDETRQPVVNAPVRREYPAQQPFVHILRQLGPNWRAISELCASWDFEFAVQADMIERGDIQSLLEAYDWYADQEGRPHSPH
jgi:uncharacterized protein YpiB (UPF0302 family)